MPSPPVLTERQQKWFAAVQEGLERETGRSLEAWTALAHTCPEIAPRKRLAWMKATYGIGQNRATMILDAAFPPASTWSEPDGLADRLWTDANSRAIHDVVRNVALALPGTIVGQRKGFTAFSRQFQFASIKPARGGAVLGLAVAPEASVLLRPAARDGWSERLLGRIEIGHASEVTSSIVSLLRVAWEKS